jgi:hypothetical protein
MGKSTVVMPEYMRPMVPMAEQVKASMLAMVNASKA